MLVGGDRVAEDGEDARAGEVDERPRGGAEVVEEARLADVGRAVVPREGVAGGDLERAPVGVALEDVGVALLVLVAAHRLAQRLRDGGGRRPDVAQEHRRTVAPDPERLGLEVDVHRAGERVGDDERRRREVVGAHDGLTRPSKLRLPDRTEHTTRLPSLTAAAIASSTGPELPMQVVQP